MIEFFTSIKIEFDELDKFKLSLKNSDSIGTGHTLLGRFFVLIKRFWVGYHFVIYKIFFS